MSRLYWRIFVAFWCVLLLTLGVTVAVNTLMSRGELASSRMQSLAASMDALAEQAQRTLSDSGEAGLRAWLREKEANLQVPMFIIDPDGNELLGRPPPRPMQRMPGPAVPREGGPGAPRAWRHLRDRVIAGGRLAPGSAIGSERGANGRPRPRILQDARGDYVFLAFARERAGERWLPKRDLRGLFLLIFIPISGIACFMLARYLTRPIRAFREAGQRIGSGDLTARIGAPIDRRKDEFGALAQDFDRMAEQVEALLESKQRLLREVSHELRSPLARLQAATGLLRQQSGDADNPNLDRIEREAGTLNDMIGQILTFSRLQSMEQVAREPVDVVELVAMVVNNANYEGQAIGRAVIINAPDTLCAELDPLLVQGAIDNVVRNAVQHSRKQTEVTVREIDGVVKITVVDDGPGAPEEHLGKLFDVFFTAEPSNSAAGHGAGIGLAIARRAAELHGGSIVATNRLDGAGLQVTVTLPNQTARFGSS